MDTYVAGAYWGARKETAQDCAQRASLFFKQLASVSDNLSQWRLRGGNRKSGAENTILDHKPLPEMTKTLQAGVNRKDMGDRNIIPELGYRLGLWNGKASSVEMQSIRIQCGAYSKNRAFENNVTISPLLSFDTSNKAEVRKLAVAFIDAWKPQFFILTRKSRLNKAAAAGNAGGGQWDPFLDIALYLDTALEEKFHPDKYKQDLITAGGRLFLA